MGREDEGRDKERDYVPIVKQVSVHHIQPNEVWTLTLSRYQRDNLLLLLNVCGYPSDEMAVEPFTLMNNGDWIGEIVWALEKGPAGNLRGARTAVIDEDDHPNTSVEGLREDVTRWLKGKIKEAAQLDAVPE